MSRAAGVQDDTRRHGGLDTKKDPATWRGPYSYAADRQSDYGFWSILTGARSAGGCCSCWAARSARPWPPASPYPARSDGRRSIDLEHSEEQVPRWCLPGSEHQRLRSRRLSRHPGRRGVPGEMIIGDRHARVLGPSSRTFGIFVSRRPALRCAWRRRSCRFAPHQVR